MSPIWNDEGTIIVHGNAHYYQWPEECNNITCPNCRKPWKYDLCGGELSSLDLARIGSEDTSYDFDDPALRVDRVAIRHNCTCGHTLAVSFQETADEPNNHTLLLTFNVRKQGKPKFSAAAPYIGYRMHIYLERNDHEPTFQEALDHVRTTLQRSIRMGYKKPQSFQGRTLRWLRNQIDPLAEVLPYV